MQTVLVVAIIGLLAVWGALSAVVQVRVPRTRRLRRHDPSGMLGRFNLFAPKPIGCDLVVRYRVFAQKGDDPSWERLPYPPRRRPTDGLFSRARRSKRILYGQAERVVRIYDARRAEPSTVIRSAPYQHLLARSRHEVSDRPAWGVQFQVIRIAGPASATTPLFRSAIHTAVPR